MATAMAMVMVVEERKGTEKKRKEKKRKEEHSLMPSLKVGHDHPNPTSKKPLPPLASSIASSSRWEM